MGMRIKYKVTHPLYGKENIFDSWLILCEATSDIAGQIARERLKPEFEKLALEIADEMINTAEEYEC